MIVCSCAVISDHDIEHALVDLMCEPRPPLPTPGVVWRHLDAQMDCCGCARLAVEVIYDRLDALETKGLLCPYHLANVRTRRHQSRTAPRQTQARSARIARSASPPPAVAHPRPADRALASVPSPPTATTRSPIVSTRAASTV